MDDRIAILIEQAARDCRDAAVALEYVLRTSGTPDPATLAGAFGRLCGAVELVGLAMRRDDDPVRR